MSYLVFKRHATRVLTHYPSPSLSFSVSLVCLSAFAKEGATAVCTKWPRSAAPAVCAVSSSKRSRRKILRDRKRTWVVGGRCRPVLMADNTTLLNQSYAVSCIHVVGSR